MRGRSADAADAADAADGFLLDFAVEHEVGVETVLMSRKPGAERGSRMSGTSGASRATGAGQRRGQTAPASALVPPRLAASAHTTIETGVGALGYELVDVERLPRGLLRVTIDRIPGQAYADGGEAITVDDCELVTRQLQYALEVEGVPYERLEVSSPGLDRALKTPAHYQRFAGAAVELTLRLPLQGRKVFRGVLGLAEGGAYTLVFDDGKGEQVLGFALDEVREARLVPVLDFKGRRQVKAQAADTPASAVPGPQDGGQER